MSAPPTITFIDAQAALSEGYCPAYPMLHGPLGVRSGYCRGCDGTWSDDILTISLTPFGSPRGPAVLWIALNSSTWSGPMAAT